MDKDNPKKIIGSQVNVHNILRKLCGVPVQTWVFENRPAVAHLGITESDFDGAFNLGESLGKIDTGNALGVAFAAIQALAERVDELEKELKETN